MSEGGSESAPDPREAAERAVRGSGLAALASGDQPAGPAVLAAIGGARGIVESILPGLLFLVVYAVTKDVVWSVLAPAAIALVLLAIRLVRRETVTSAIGGIVLVAISAAIALFSGRAENNFLPGFAINTVGLLAMVVSLLVRRPLIGVVAGLLLGYRNWRRRRARRRTAVWATIAWIGLFGLRLAVEVPLWAVAVSATDPTVVEPATSALATARLVLGVPLYAFVLWITWLLMRGPWASRPAASTPGGTPAEPPADGPAAPVEPAADDSRPPRDVS
ncbi:MAG: DUF3159 domain-containing protein [Actinomycetales bacterium]|nr:DUF3159 domain-containing protein [Actinomycetales bacterium]